MSQTDPHQRLLISAKAILHRHGRLLLVKNARSEWELPGGKLQRGEDLEKCLERELREELSLSIASSKVIGAFKHHFYDDIVVVAYDCGSPNEVEYSLGDEHIDGGWFDPDQLQAINLPEAYRQVISDVCRRGGGNIDG